MTHRLRDVLDQVPELSPERQNDAAQILHAMLENDACPYPLTDQQLEEVDAARSDVANGEFATDYKVQEALHRSWA